MKTRKHLRRLTPSNGRLPRLSQYSQERPDSNLAQFVIKVLLLYLKRTPNSNASTKNSGSVWVTGAGNG